MKTVFVVTLKDNKHHDYLYITTKEGMAEKFMAGYAERFPGSELVLFKEELH